MSGWLTKFFSSSPPDAADPTVRAKAEDCKNKGNAHLAAQELELAANCYRQAIAIDPLYAEAFNNLGLVFLQKGETDQAIDCFRTAIDIKPQLVQGHLNLADARKAQGRPHDAAAILMRAICIAPQLPQVHNNLGVLLHEQGQLADAAAKFQEALCLDPEYADALNNLGTVLREQNRPDDALSCFEAAIALNPGLAVAHNNIGSVAQDRGQLGRAYSHYQKAISLKPDYAEAMSNYLLVAQYDPALSPSDLYSKHLSFAEHFEAPLRPLWPMHPNARNVGRRLRIGFVSGDFRVHPVGHFIEGVLAQLDRQVLDITLYPTTPREDELSRRLIDMNVSWQPLYGLPDAVAAQRIAEDCIDILVDLSGHTADNRLLVFARKPAPIQVSWLYFSTTGLSAMDYLLCDKHVVPVADEGLLVERPWRLPDAYLCFTPPTDVVPVGDLPALRNDHITFGCFNNLTKMNDAVVNCWAALLKAVPKSRLFLKARQLGTASLQQSTIERFGMHGIAADRLVLEGGVPRSQYLASYNRVDIALDPFPFPGGATTVESLWMGVPVLTRQGDRFISRAGESILANVKLYEWIASDQDDYIAKATAQAARIDHLAELRAGLRSRFVASPLCDAPRFARNLEIAFLKMWSIYCQSPQVLPHSDA